MRDTQGFLREESRECPSNLHSASEDHSNPHWEALGPRFSHLHGKPPAVDTVL